MRRSCNISWASETVVFDMSRGFDVVDIEASVGLLHKFKSYGISLSCLVLLFCFLISGRFQESF